MGKWHFQNFVNVLTAVFEKWKDETSSYSFTTNIKQMPFNLDVSI